MTNGFFRGHGLGNDYVVLDPAQLSFPLTPSTIAAICDRHTGLGSDGILTPRPSANADFGLRIFNPDGSEAEKSGNGLRIFARYLYATGRTTHTRFTVETPGGIVAIQLNLDEYGEASSVTVDMGRASFDPTTLPCLLATRDLIAQPIDVGGESLTFTGVSVGNPHCVIFASAERPWQRADLLRLGPALEHHPLFPQRTNVQLAVSTGPAELAILIWERGAGETMASGSSACAAASAAVRLGFVTSPVTVTMPGGDLTITVDENELLTMTGPVAEVARGVLSSSFVRGLP